MRKKKKLALRDKILLLAGSLFVFLFIMEVTARLCFRIPRDIDYGIYPGLLGDHLPDQDLVAIHTSYDRDAPFAVRINSEGLRGKEGARTKEAGTIRVLCLGDSLTYGLFLNDGDTFPDRLQMVLDGCAGPGRYEVINAGHLDYTVTEEMEYLQERGLMLQPDWIVLQFTATNDIEDLTRPESMRSYYRDLASQNRWVRATQRFLRRWRLYQAMVYVWTRLRARYWYTQIYPEGDARLLDKHMYFDAVDQSWKMRNDALKVEREIFSSPGFQERLDLLWDKYAATFTSLKRLADDRDIGVVLLFFPDPSDLCQEPRPLESAGYSFDAKERLRSLAMRSGVSSYVDLTDAFRTAQLEKGLKLYEKLHPTAAASQIAAKEVADLLISAEAGG